jgi:hypothetical protein
VYAHLNPISLKPFYIGKGKGSRWLCKNDRSVFWNNYVNKYGFIPIKLVDGIEDHEACEIEKQYIAKYGFIKAGGLLVNLTKGGTGGNTFDPIGGKNWNSGKKGIYKPEVIERFRQSRLGKKLPPEQKEKVLAGLKKASEASLLSRTHKVKCLITGRIWDGRKECALELGISIDVFKRWIYIDRPIKGYHLQLIKNQ